MHLRGNVVAEPDRPIGKPGAGGHEAPVPSRVDARKRTVETQVGKRRRGGDPDGGQRGQQGGKQNAHGSHSLTGRTEIEQTRALIQWVRDSSSTSSVTEKPGR